MRCIGLRKHGALVAAAIYEGFNGQNMWVHLAGLPGARWMTRDFLRAGFAYPFLVCGVKRLSGYVNAGNTWRVVTVSCAPYWPCSCWRCSAFTGFGCQRSSG